LLMKLAAPPQVASISGGVTGAEEQL